MIGFCTICILNGELHDLRQLNYGMLNTAVNNKCPLISGIPIPLLAIQPLLFPIHDTYSDDIHPPDSYRSTGTGFSALIEANQSYMILGQDMH